jgi:hypothetical protein
MVGVGDEVEMPCSKCGTGRVHAIVAKVKDRIAKIRCNTCGHLVRYKDPNAKTRPRKQAKMTPKERWEALVSKSSGRKRTAYVLTGSFGENDLIDHSTFGLGVVTQVLPDRKMHVIFEEGEKMLVNERIPPVAVLKGEKSS